MEFTPQLVDWAIHGGNISVLALVLWVAWKMNKRLDRDETLKQDFPPHRHINGSKIVYPKEYEPSVIERLSE